jgi:hypothetical protein
MTITARIPPTWWENWHALLTPDRRRAVRHGIVVAGVAGTAIAGWISYVANAGDAYAYWAARAPSLYGGWPGSPLAYLYSPAFAQLISPLQRLPENVFVALSLVAILIAVLWLAGPRLLALAVVVAWADITTANILVCLAVAIVLGFRFGGAWAFPLLTKVTPGVGLLWFVRRREWRRLWAALLVTALVVGVSFVADQQSWLGWLDLLRRSSDVPAIQLSAPIPLWLKLIIAAVIVWWGAGRLAKWTVPLAPFLALPIVWPASPALLLAAIPLADRSRLRPSWRKALA